MKNIISVTFLLISVVTSSFGQLNKGKFLVGASASFLQGNMDHVEFFQDLGNQKVSFGPKLGFSFSKNWIVGAVASIDKHHDFHAVSSALSIERTTSDYSGGAFLRRFQPFNEKFGIIADFNVNYRVYKCDRTFNGSIFENSVQRQYLIFLTPGIYYKPLKRFFMESTFGRVGYAHTTVTPPDGPIVKRDELIPSNITLGLYFIL